MRRATASSWSRRATSRSPRHMADAYFRVRHEPVATLTSCGPGSCNIVMPLAGRAVGFLGAAGDHRQRADLAVQPLAVPGDQQALPGRLPQHHPPGGEAQLPADARRHAAARAAPGDDHDAVGPARPGECRRAVQRVPGGGRRRGAAGRRRRSARQRSGASPDEIAACARPDPEGEAPGASSSATASRSRKQPRS